MGQIQTNTGLISGINFGDMVTKLMQIAGRSRDLLQTQTDALTTQQTDVTQLQAMLLSVKYISDNLGKDALYTASTATSSNPSALTATVTSGVAAGTYQFTPVRLVQSNQLLSSGFSNSTDPLGGGTVTFRFGSDVQRTSPLEFLNGGQGVSRGSIRITDRSGAHADVNLTAVQTVDDVLNAINSSTSINVQAIAQGDHIQLIDKTGQTVSNLKVEEIGGGSTAASLGLAGVNVAANSANGQDLLKLSNDLNPSALNDGNGVRTSAILPDVEYQLRDGTTGTIDFSPILPNSSQVAREKTLGDFIAEFNAANPTKLQLAIAPDGKRLIATDLTTGSSAFQLTAINGSGALADLGLTGAASGGVITGWRIIGGADTVLLSSLGGGQGLGSLGLLSLTDRSGASATVDLSQAETLDDVLTAINSAGVGITARVNQAGNGVELDDTSGSQAGNMVVANADGTNTADALHVAVNSAVTSVNSGDLHLQVVSENTSLTDLNGGAGVARGTLTIQDTNGQQATLDLRSTGIQTVGDVIQAINRLPLAVHAEINQTGDGIRIVDTAHGTQSLQVNEGNSTTAADLHLTHAAVQVQIAGQATQVVDGSTTYTVSLTATDSLTDLVDKINALGAGVTAATVNDGSSRPYRLSVSSNHSGKIGNLVFDTSGTNLAMQETAQGQDALLLVGNAANSAANMLVSSPTNSFTGVVPGMTLNMLQASNQPVAISVNSSDSSIATNVQALVDNYNKYRKQYSTLTAYNTTTNTAADLTGDATALRLDMDLANLLSGQFGSGRSLQSLAQIGVTLGSDGTLGFDQSVLDAAYSADPNAVKSLFTDKTNGISAKFAAALGGLADGTSSLLTARTSALSDEIQHNKDSITLMNARLDTEQTNLYTQFYNMEVALAKLQGAMNSINLIQPIDMNSSNNSSNSYTSVSSMFANKSG